MGETGGDLMVTGGQSRTGMYQVLVMLVGAGLAGVGYTCAGGRVLGTPVQVSTG